jgi:signal peptide peptidase SppA
MNLGASRKPKSWPRWLLIKEKEMDRYSQIISYIREQPWAIRASYLAVMRDIIHYRNAGGEVTPEEVQARIGPNDEFIQDLQAQQKAAERQGAGLVAVIPVFGIIAQHAHMVEDISGPRGTATERISEQIRGAIDNPNVEKIVLNIHSPGGSVYGVEELAAEIRSARGKKPIIAVANAMAASAAYYIASAASEIVVTPSGEVGSIGVFSAHEDLSEALKMEGVKITLISAGKYKTETNPFEPLSDEAREHEQSVVDKYYGLFVNSVAKGRGVSAATIRKDFGQGRMVTAKDAVGLGMADRVATLEDTLARAAKKRGRSAEEDDFGYQFTFGAEDGKITLETINNLVYEDDDFFAEGEAAEKPTAEQEDNGEDECELAKQKLRLSRIKQRLLDKEQ